jgi:hypothetical protein
MSCACHRRLQLYLRLQIFSSLTTVTTSLVKKTLNRKAKKSIVLWLSTYLVIASLMIASNLYRNVLLGHVAGRYTFPVRPDVCSCLYVLWEETGQRIAEDENNYIINRFSGVPAWPHDIPHPWHNREREREGVRLYSTFYIPPFPSFTRTLHLSDIEIHEIIQNLKG